MRDTKITLPESEIPTHFYNIAPDLPTPLLPPLHPGTREPIGPEALAPIFPMGLIAQEVSQEPTIEIPDDVRDIYRLYRPTPVYRAHALEKLLDTPARIYYKSEHVSPVGSHKLNTALMQAWVNKQEGVKRLATETGAGQWGSALSCACQLMGLECMVYMVRISYDQKPYRRIMMNTYGGKVVPSPSPLTSAGRAILAQHPDSTGSLGIAISEAVEDAAGRDDTKYALGSVLNHVLLHQTVIGQEAVRQMELAGDYPDLVIACHGGGSNFAGLAFPFLRDKLRGTRKALRAIAVEPAACASLTQGTRDYDFGDTAGTTPLMMMHSLGRTFIPPTLHAGGLRYHGSAPLVSHLLAAGVIEAEAYHQGEVFESAVMFARCEGTIPAPESAHAIHSVIKHALAARQAGETKVILFNLSGHGLFDLAAYDAFLNDTMDLPGMTSSLKAGASMLGFALATHLLLAQAPPQLPAYKPDDVCTFTSQPDVPTAMRDGTILRSNVFTPDQPGPFPVVMIRLPYNKDRPMTNSYGLPDVYASHCYIVVSQDVRGQYKSDGTWYPFRSEATDGYDTIEWAARLPKSSGKVGMYGRSYPGATQWLPATLRPPHLAAIVPAMTSSDYHDNWNYDGGALLQAFAEDWPPESIAASAMRRFPDGAALGAEFAVARKDYLTRWSLFLPLRDWPVLHPEDPRIASYFYDWVRHPDNDDYWRQWSIRERWNQITVPALNLDGWYDIFLNGAVDNFSGMRRHGGSEIARQGQRLVIGPWVHISWVPKVGQLDFGPEAANPMQQMMLRWYDYWLKGIQNGVDKEPKVRLFVMGANTWRTANDWPVEGTAFRAYYLHSQGGANTASGNGTLDTNKPDSAGGQQDRYRYDPANPVPSVGGRFMSVLPGGPYDQTPVLTRPDVLVYTTAQLEKDVEVTGPITVSLYAASSATDTDFTAKLDDVYPDGRSMVLNYGIQRARYRDSGTHPTLIKPGQIYKYAIQVWPTSNLFKAGHAIRLEVSSSNFPMWDRNPNTGHPFGQDAELQVADQTIFHDKDHPSSITLPILESPIR